MSFLAPLYILGTLGLALPVLLHLIRRTPRGQVPFGSLMFLSPTPPRLTRRSRLDNLLLLLLRCAALTLLALAFARPFLREAAALILNTDRQRYAVILLDTSASMRRAALWQAAKDRVEQFLAETTPADHIALLTFDDWTTIRADFRDVDEFVVASQRADMVRDQLSELQPGWCGTDLGKALTTAADLLDAAADADREAGDVELVIVLVSDLQSGSDVAALRAFEWPARVRLQVERVTADDPTNAGLQALADSDAAVDADGKVRLRVINDADSTVEQFRITSEGSESSGSGEMVYVPPGQNRIVRVTASGDPNRATTYRILGDDHEFDNTVYLAPRLRRQVRVVYVGRDSAEDPQGTCYYLHLALADTPTRKVQLVAIRPDTPLPSDERASLVVVADPPTESTTDQIGQFLDSGGRVLVVLRDEQSVRFLQHLLGMEEISIEDARPDDYALLVDIDWTHPLFSAFSGSRYGDFAKIHFWNYRRMLLPEDSSIDVLARFDRGGPAVCELRYPSGGRLTILTSGWQPSDSQFALSTKFVPFVSRLLPGSLVDWPNSYSVGQDVLLPDELLQADAVRIQRPDGTTHEISREENPYSEADEPGIYRATAGDREYSFAVNIAGSESRTVPMDIEELEQLGVVLMGTGKPAAIEQNERQMRDVELERQQQLWRWLILGAIAVLLVETYVAGRLARPLPQEV